MKKGIVYINKQSGAIVKPKNNTRVKVVKQNDNRDVVLEFTKLIDPPERLEDNTAVMTVRKGKVKVTAISLSYEAVIGLAAVLSAYLDMVDTPSAEFMEKFVSK